MKHVQVEYIESGAFQGGEEDVFNADITYDEECIVLKKADFERVMRSLNKIARYDEEPIWADDRDDSADAMLRLARVALGEEEEES